MYDIAAKFKFKIFLEFFFLHLKGFAVEKIYEIFSLKVCQDKDNFILLCHPNIHIYIRIYGFTYPNLKTKRSTAWSRNVLAFIVPCIQPSEAKHFFLLLLLLLFKKLLKKNYI